MSVKITVYTLDGLKSYTEVYTNDIIKENEWDLIPKFLTPKDLSFKKADKLQNHIITSFLENDWDEDSVVRAMIGFHPENVKIKCEVI